MVLRAVPSDGRRIVWSNAGHNPPLLLRRSGEIEISNLAARRSGSLRGPDGVTVEQRFATR